jgi:hypothetical protein
MMLISSIHSSQPPKDALSSPRQPQSRQLKRKSLKPPSTLLPDPLRIHRTSTTILLRKIVLHYTSPLLLVCRPQQASAIPVLPLPPIRRSQSNTHQPIFRAQQSVSSVLFKIKDTNNRKIAVRSNRKRVNYKSRVRHGAWLADTLGSGRVSASHC